MDVYVEPTEDSTQEHVKLFGEITIAEPWEFQRQYFPSKVGGLPAWLQPANLPPEEDFSCARCSGVMTFVLQLYAPDDEEPTGDAFHRMLYLFACQPCKTQWRAYRSQLPRGNQHYSYHPEKERRLFPQPDFHMARQCCMACGLPSREIHEGPPPVSLPGAVQEVCIETEWRALHPRCQIAVKHETLRANLPESLVLITEGPKKKPANHLKRERELYEQYQKKEREGKCLDELDESEEKAIESIQKERIVVDNSFEKLCKITGPDDVIFYCRDDEPIWISDKTIRLKCAGEDDTQTENLVPRCELCGGPRSFEFQVLPQLLFHLSDISLDFGSVLVYTCANSCKLDGAYKEEFIYVEKDYSMERKPSTSSS